MDISQWVQGVVAAETPGSNPGCQLTVPSIFQPKNDRRPVHRKRKRSSSFLEPVDPDHQRVTRSRSRETDHRRYPSSSSSAHYSSDCETRSSSDRYKRKPRRKTRTDRYDLKHGKFNNRRGKKATTVRTKSRKDRSTRRKKRKAETALSDKFHAKNVSKDRLTLRPGTVLGIFGNAKTSASSRRQELPDLAFSEMKFLQEQRDSAEDRLRGEHPSTTRKKVKEKIREGEISTYFVPETPALKEVSRNVQTTRVTKTARMAQVKTQSMGTGLVLPTIEQYKNRPGRQLSGEVTNAPSSYLSRSSSAPGHGRASASAAATRKIRTDRHSDRSGPSETSTIGNLQKPVDPSLWRGSIQSQTGSKRSTSSSDTLPGESKKVSQKASIPIEPVQQNARNPRASIERPTSDDNLPSLSGLHSSPPANPRLPFIMQRNPHMSPKVHRNESLAHANIQKNERALEPELGQVDISSSCVRLFESGEAEETHQDPFCETDLLSQGDIDIGRGQLPDIYPELWIPTDGSMTDEVVWVPSHRNDAISDDSRGIAKRANRLDDEFVPLTMQLDESSEADDQSSIDQGDVHLNCGKPKLVGLTEGFDDNIGEGESDFRYANEPRLIRQDGPLATFWRPNKLY